MEKAGRSQFVRWQLILGAVVCAIVAFCVLPGSVIAASAAEPVTYIDRTWDEKTKTVKEEIKTFAEYSSTPKRVSVSGYPYLRRFVKFKSKGNLL